MSSALPRVLSGVLLLSVACSDNTQLTGADLCNAVDLPIAGDQDAPLVTDVALEAQTGDGIVVLATASDPQGSDNIRDVPQIIRVFQDAGCENSPIVLEDDLAYSGVEESFGIAVPRSNPLFSVIAAAETWPVELDFRDLDGNATSARVLARVIPVDQGLRLSAFGAAGSASR